MKTLLTAIIIFCGLLTSFSQEVKKVSLKSKSPSVIEEYFVLKKSKDVKHGEYLKTSYGGDILEKGFFKNGKRDSLWVYFANKGVDTTFAGNYLDDKRVGEWAIFDKGVFSYNYNYTTDSVSNYQWNGASNRFPVLINSKWTESEIDSPPLVTDGENPNSIISRNLRYPTRAWKSGISGQVDVAFTVDSTGRMSNVRIKEGADPEFNNEAKRVVALLNTIWFPAKKDGKSVTIEYFLPVKFILRK